MVKILGREREREKRLNYADRLVKGKSLIAGADRMTMEWEISTLIRGTTKAGRIRTREGEATQERAEEGSLKGRNSDGVNRGGGSGIENM